MSTIKPTGAMSNNQRLLLIVAGISFAVCLAFYATNKYVQHKKEAALAQAAAAAASNSGRDLLVEHRPAQLSLVGLRPDMEDGDTLGITLNISSSNAANMVGTADEANGTLIPTLTLIGCNVDSTEASPVRTTQPFEAFRWHWSAVCSSAGQHELEVALAFALDKDADSGTSDPMAYRWSQVLTSHESPLSQVVGIVTPLAAIVGVVTSLMAAFGKKRRSPNGES